MTIEVNPRKLLGMEIMIKHGIIETFVVVKESKVITGHRWPNYWSSTVCKKYKWNAILGDLHRAHKISSNFEVENSVLRKNFVALLFRTISFNLLSILIIKMWILNS